MSHLDHPTTTESPPPPPAANVIPQMEPGRVIRIDCRPQVAAPTSTTTTAAPTTSVLPPIFKVMQWNIERGYELERILAALRTEKPDIAILQELDIG
ncbi:hypothetical protein H4R33_007278, partial [Dimargaris cristalligena]